MLPAADQKRIEAVGRGTALVAMVLGSCALGGWWLHVPTLRSGIPGLVAMNPVTAILFLLVGLVLFLPPHPGWGHRCAIRSAGVVVILVGVLCVSRIVSAWDLGPDRWLFHDQLLTGFDGHPNRMAPNTACDFILIGIALVLAASPRERVRRMSLMPAALAGLAALVVVLGYSYGSPHLYAIGHQIPMALNTAIGFVLVSCGLVVCRPSMGGASLLHSATMGGTMARRLLPAVLVIPPLIGWLRLTGESAGYYDTAGGIAVVAIATTLVMALLVWLSAMSIDRAARAQHAAELEIRQLNEALESRVRDRTAELRSEVTERQRAEEALRRTADELRGWFDASPLANCCLTPDGHVLSWNRAAEELFGWTADEVVGQPLPIVSPEYDGEGVALQDRVLAGNPVTNYETRRMRKDGTLRDVSISTAALHDASGAVSGLAVIYADISERVNLEAQLRQSQKMEAIGRLAGGVAHDFNNILTVIHNASEFLLADMAVGDVRRNDARDIHDAADRAASLTRQLLAFSRQQVLHLRVIDLNAVVTPIEPMVRRLVEETIEIVVRTVPDLYPIHADPGQLDQVILNLVVNSRDAMPNGGSILIETSNVTLDDEYPRSHAAARAGPHVLLSVSDTGLGMDPDTQARIFEPFFTTKPIGQGTGLGLATVYGIVKQLGGHIWVYSEVERGTTFKIYFPRYVGEDLAAPVAEPATPAGQPRGTAPAGTTVLLVEDDVAVRGTIRRLLERYGYLVLEAPNGSAALMMLADSAPAVHLVLSDMVMPEMNGLELRRRLRQSGVTVPVLLMSGYSEEAITRLGAAESLAPLIEKPFTLEAILRKVEETLAA